MSEIESLLLMIMIYILKRAKKIESEPYMYGSDSQPVEKVTPKGGFFA